MRPRFVPSAGLGGPAEEQGPCACGSEPGDGIGTAASRALRVPPDSPAASSVIAFLKIEKAPRLLASLGSRVPPDVIPMPIQRLSRFGLQAHGTPIAFSGVVVCVPENTLAEDDRNILRDLGRLIPIFRVRDDPREVGLTFFERCREATPRIPRSVGRFEFRRPVVVARAEEPGDRRLLVAENLSEGGLFIKDPRPSCGTQELLQLRFPGLAEVPALLGRIRWVRSKSPPGSVPGYGCAFDRPSDPAVRRLLSGARALIRESLEPKPLGLGGLPGKWGRR